MRPRIAALLTAFSLGGGIGFVIPSPCRPALLTGGCQAVVVPRFEEYAGMYQPHDDPFEVPDEGDEGRSWRCPAWTYVTVIQLAGELALVRVNDGRLKGRVGWTDGGNLRALR